MPKQKNKKLKNTADASGNLEPDLSPEQLKGNMWENMKTEQSAQSAEHAKIVVYRQQVLRQQQQRLLLLRHSDKCLAGMPQHPEECFVPHCAQMKVLWQHIAKCKDQQCKTSYCVSSRHVLSHYQRCKNKVCSICGPVREMIKSSMWPGGNTQPQGRGNARTSGTGNDILVLVVKKQPVDRFYKDEGGKKKCMECTMALESKDGQQITLKKDEKIVLKCRLYFESGTRLEENDQSILNLLPNGLEPITIATSGIVTVRFRIEKVSRRKDCQRFKLFTEVDPEESIPEVGHIQGCFSQPISVFSKTKRSRPRSSKPVDGGKRSKTDPTNEVRALRARVQELEQELELRARVQKLEQELEQELSKVRAPFCSL